MVLVTSLLLSLICTVDTQVRVAAGGAQWLAASLRCPMAWA